MEKEINYGEIIKEAWQITWKNKFLWGFGLLLAFSSGVSFPSNFGRESEWEKKLGESFSAFAAAHSQELFFLLGLIFLVFVIFFILGILGRGALIDSLGKIARKKEASFRAGMKEGKIFFGRILLFQLFFLGMIVAALLVLGTPIAVLFYLKAQGLAFFLVFLAFLILLVLLVLFSFLWEFGLLYAVLGNLSVWSALDNAYLLFRKNLTTSLILGIILIAFNLLFGFFTLISLLVFGFFLMSPGLLAYFFAGKAIAAGIALLVVSVSLALAWFLLINSIFLVFSQAVWVLFFRQIALFEEENRSQESLEILKEIKEEIEKEKALPAPQGAKMLKKE